MSERAAHIVAVDDDEAIRYAVTHVLRGAGFEVTEASTGTAALKAVRQCHPDLVLLDVNLPDIMGYEVCKRIKADPSTSSIPVLHLSASYVDAEARIAGLNSGADGYLAQPVSRDELLATVRALLRIKRAEEHARQEAERAQAVKRELEQVLAALQQKNQLLQALVEACPLAIIVTDHRRNVAAWNGAAYRIFGWREEEVLGRPIPIVPPDLQEEVQGLRAQYTHRGKSLLGYETERQRRDGTRIPVRLSTSPVRDGDGKLHGTMVVVEDISQKKQAEDMLRRHDRLVEAGRMASALAHEINNPLASVVNLVYLLEQNERLDAGSREYLEVMAKELSRIETITKQMLGLHRDSTQPVPVSCTEVVEDVLNLYSRRIQENNIKVSTDARAPGLMLANPGELRQVFANIIGNALDAVGEGGRLKIRIRHARNGRGEEGVAVLISDNGPGIPAAFRERIFEPFFTTKGEKGSGLGLWVVKGIIQKHHGRLRVRTSCIAGRSGTCFGLFFPSGEIKISDGEQKSAVSTA